MNCELCQAKLKHLASGELDELSADQARAHLQTCESCRLAFERLGIPDSAAGRPAACTEPTEPLLIEARDAAISLALQSAQSQARSAAENSRNSDWRERVGRAGRLLMGRQFAVATAMLLVAAVGLWYVPRFRQNPDAGATIVDGPRSTEGEPASGALEPAEPLDLTMDRNGRRIRSRKEIAAARSRRNSTALEQATGDNTPQPVGAPQVAAGEPVIAANDAVEEIENNDEGETDEQTAGDDRAAGAQTAPALFARADAGTAEKDSGSAVAAEPASEPKVAGTER